MDKVTGVSTNHNLFEEKGEPKRYRTEVPPLQAGTLECAFIPRAGEVDEVMLNVLGSRLTY